MADLDGKPVGLVLSGGGATGAYEVGVLKALFGGKAPITGGVPLAPEICAGTSIGSYSASLLVSQLDELGPMAAANLEAVWRERLGETGFLNRSNGAFRFRGDPLGFLDPSRYVPNPLRPFAEAFNDGAFLFWDGLQRTVNLATNRGETLEQRVVDLFNVASFVSAEPFAQTISDTVSFSQIRRARTLLRVPATNWATGRLTVFTNSQMSDRLGACAILASSAIPGLIPPVLIGAQPHVDGGVLLNTPLRLVTRHAQVLHVVYLDPAVEKIPLGALQSTLDAIYRQQVIEWAKVVNDDISDAQAINGVLEVFGSLKEGKAVPNVSPGSLTLGLTKLWAREHEIRTQAGSPYRLLTIHRYHPRDDITGGPMGMLNFDRGHIEDLIDRGFEDAIMHDCDESECILPAH
jgi:predicted acylesterase/phospholipase RssA